MEKYIYDNNNGLWYELHGDYYIPLLTVPEVPPLGIWGRRRLHYLKAHRPVIYNTMLLSGELFSHLAEIDKQAGERYEHIVKLMAEKQGITEELKAQDQMAWVGAMNNIRNAAAEIINSELICV